MKKSSKYTGVYYRDRKDGDRTYYYRYRDNNSRNVQVRVGLESNGFNEKVAFEQRQNTINAQKSEEVYQGLPDIKSRHRTTLNDIADFYFHNHKTKSTLKRQRTYDFRIRDSIGKKSIYKLQPKDIIVFRDELSEKLSPQTVIIHLELISTIYNYYIQYYTIKLTNPVLHVKKPRVDNRRKRILSKEEIDLVFEELKNSFSLTLFDGKYTPLIGKVFSSDYSDYYIYFYTPTQLAKEQSLLNLWGDNYESISKFFMKDEKLTKIFDESFLIPLIGKSDREISQTVFEYLDDDYD
jgi:hypothetical protein